MIAINLFRKFSTIIHHHHHHCYLNIVLIIIFTNCLSNLILFVCSHNPNDNGKIDCLVNMTIGYSDPKNVYQCRHPMNCCFEYTKPSCCGRKPSIQIIKEQLTLWGGLFAILFCLASIVYCRKKDVNLPACTVFKNFLVRLCCGNNNSGNNDDDDDDNVGNQSTKTIMRKQRNSTLNYEDDDDDDNNNYGQEMKSNNNNDNYGQSKQKKHHHFNNKNDSVVIKTQPSMMNNNNNHHEPHQSQQTNNVIKNQQQTPSSLLWYHHRNHTKINPLPQHYQTFTQPSSSSSSSMIQMSQV
nr:uncharacterized protein DDB_G0289917-like [Dermatophagoides farinae]